MSITPFSQRLFDLACAIPPGRVTTYGVLARAAGGGPQAARSVTAILAKHPNRAVIPFHRIVYAGGRVWWNETEPASRLALFAAEGVTVTDDGRILDFEELLWDPRLESY